MERTAFTYGTLLSEKVLRAVLGRVPDRVDAKLTGYSRAPIRGQCYPAVFKTDNSSFVEGKVLLGLTENELAVLDRFEDPAYDRATVTVRTVEDKLLVARVWARPSDNIDDLVQDTDWDFERFRIDHEKIYVENCLKWASTESSGL